MLLCALPGRFCGGWNCATWSLRNKRSRPRVFFRILAVRKLKREQKPRRGRGRWNHHSLFRRYFRSRSDLRAARMRKKLSVRERLLCRLPDVQSRLRSGLYLSKTCVTRFGASYYTRPGISVAWIDLTVLIIILERFGTDAYFKNIF